MTPETKETIKTWLGRTLKWIAKLLLLVGALICFYSALVLIFDKKEAASATLMGTLFVVLILMTYLPEMETFKAFGVEMKLRARLTEAEDLVKQLRRLTILNANTAYHLLTYSNRWDSSVRANYRTASAIDEFMKEMKCDPEDIRKAKAGFVRMGLRDLYMSYHNAVMHLMMAARAEANPEVTEVINRFFALRQTIPFNENDFRASCTAMDPPAGVLAGDDEDFLRAVSKKLVKVADELTAKGVLSEAGIELLENRTTDAEYITWMKEWKP